MKNVIYVEKSNRNPISIYIGPRENILTNKSRVACMILPIDELFRSYNAHLRIDDTYKQIKNNWNNIVLINLLKAQLLKDITNDIAQRLKCSNPLFIKLSSDDECAVMDLLGEYLETAPYEDVGYAYYIFNKSITNQISYILNYFN